MAPRTGRRKGVPKSITMMQNGGHWALNLKPTSSMSTKRPWIIITATRLPYSQTLQVNLISHQDYEVGGEGKLNASQLNHKVCSGGNKKLPHGRLLASKIHSTQISPPYWSRLPLQRQGFYEGTYPTPQSLCRRVWLSLPLMGLALNNKLNNKLIYF